MDQDDSSNPIKSETTLKRSYLKMYTPTWGNNKVRLNKFSDSNSIWMPFPISMGEYETFIDLLHNEE